MRAPGGVPRMPDRPTRVQASAPRAARLEQAHSPTIGDMTAERPQLTVRNLDHPDAIRPLGRGTGGFVDLGGGLVIGRAVLQPGWRWSEDVKSVVGTPSC